MQVYLASLNSSVGEMRFSRRANGEFEVELRDISLGFKLMGSEEDWLCFQPPGELEHRIPAGRVLLYRTAPTRWGGRLRDVPSPYGTIELALPWPKGELDIALCAAMDQLDRDLAPVSAVSVQLSDASAHVYAHAVLALVLLSWERYILSRHVVGRWRLLPQSPTPLMCQARPYEGAGFTLDLAPEPEEAEAPETEAEAPEPEPEPEPLLTV